MSQEFFWVLLSKKLSGEASPEELKELENLILEHPEWQYAIQNLQDLWKHQPPKNDLEAEDAYMLHLHRMTEKNVAFDDRAALTPVVSLNSRIRRKWYWAAAAVLITTGLFAFGTLFNRKDKKAIVVISEINEVSTRQGSKSKIQLPDGSVVWLNAGSKLTYNKDYNQQLREVTLSGEGYFDIIKNKDKPFIIYTSNIDIKVLGTAFNVKAYPEDKQTETSLIRGSIEVTIKNRPNNKIILSPNEKLVVYKEPGEKGNTHLKEKELPEKIALVTIKQLSYQNNDSIAVEAAWIRDRLSFKNELFADVAKKMERWYDVSFVFENKRKENLLMYGTFTTETLEEALAALEFSFGFRYKIEHKKVTIY